VNGDALLGDFLEGVFERTLDGGDLGLELPAVEVGAVVGNGEFDILHGCVAAEYLTREKSTAPQMSTDKTLESGLDDFLRDCFCRYGVKSRSLAALRDDNFPVTPAVCWGHAGI
jgi:hypothetical protein